MNPDPASELWSLVSARCEPGADKAALDARIWERFGADGAVMFTDLSGFSRRVAEFGIIHFPQVIHEQAALLLPLVSAHGGLHLKTEADSFLLYFEAPREALRCAVAMQGACDGFNRGRNPEDQVLLCVGLGWGRLLKVGTSDVYGREVNAASKLGEDTAKSGEILVTDAFRKAVEGQGDWSFEPIEAVAGSDVNWRVGYR